MCTPTEVYVELVIYPEYHHQFFTPFILRTPLGYEPGVVNLLLINSNDLDDLLSPTPTTLVIARRPSAPPTPFPTLEERTNHARLKF